ncbi:hypothetical protein RLO149_c008990 [Roseobacter litoralis Och 149]|uniref:Uncharacterized protein n=1 Tax=Roseobacter litoralis (strain ATCC 49566 / DSM 6996 / JCM 21268 / NBRC 15278 / OCh 149) TaxID=391595 RepID=F7Z9W3_ROSLO|nr:hypothetical protein RLO149_c008990 [Roseobacter litoralis Och 149]
MLSIVSLANIACGGHAGGMGKLGGQAAILATVSLPSSRTATRCAPCGDHRMRHRLPF